MKQPKSHYQGNDKDNVLEHDKTGRPSASAGMTKGGSVGSGLSEHRQIKASLNSYGMGHGRGQRPEPAPMMKETHGGRSFKTK